MAKILKSYKKAFRKSKILKIISKRQKPSGLCNLLIGGLDSMTFSMIE